MNEQQLIQELINVRAMATSTIQRVDNILSKIQVVEKKKRGLSKEAAAKVVNDFRMKMNRKIQKNQNENNNL